MVEDEEIAKLTDIFDGAAFREKRGYFDADVNIALALFVDGFQPFKRSKVNLTIVHLLVLNLPPMERQVVTLAFRFALSRAHGCLCSSVK